jgi:hypothetical protein
MGIVQSGLWPGLRSCFGWKHKLEPALDYPHCLTFLQRSAGQQADRAKAVAMAKAFVISRKITVAWRKLIIWSFNIGVRLPIAEPASAASAD